MANHTILIADDEAPNRDFLTDLLTEEGYAVTSAVNGRDAISKLSQEPYNVVLTDLQMPEVDGLGVIQYIVERKLNTIAILYTGYASVKSAVDAMKLGAFDYLTKPFKADEIKVVVKKALDHLALQEENLYLKQQLKARYKFENIVGTSDKMQKIFSLIDKVASTDSTVLILGESGTGKELVARALHFNSPRASSPFVPVNCGAIPEELLESELFGHEKGAFTGAFRTRIGRFELAGGGSIFLDEISEMSPNLQVKLLRVIQEREFERVGGVRSIKADVRIIAATNKNLDEEVSQGRFREDLYYRLNVIPIHIPPLRERPDDIPLLVKHFLAKYTAEGGRRGPEFSKRAVAALLRYRWPGNVRELENLVERMVVLCESDVIDLADLPEKIASGGMDGSSIAPAISLPDNGIDLSTAVNDFERSIIIQALNKSNWVKNRAAKLLNLNRTTLVEKIKKQKLERPNEPNLT
jgi:DNA-binding NtrC family response regulator